MIIQFWIWSPRNRRKTPSFPAHFRIAAFGCQRVYCPSSFSLELCLQPCIHKLPKLIALCFLAVRVLNSGVKRKRASSEHSLSPRSATRCMSSRHRGQLSVGVEAVTNSSRCDLVFSCCSVSTGPKETARTTRLVLTSSIPRGDCSRSDENRLHSSTSRSARPGTRHHSSRICCSQPPQPSLSIRWTTCEQSHQMHC